MEFLWALIGSVVGASAVYLALKGQIRLYKKEAVAEQSRANDAEKAHQTLQIEIAALRKDADRVQELISKSGEDESRILDLSAKYSAATASVDNKNEIINSLKDQLDAVSEEAKVNKDSATKLEIRLAEVSSKIEEREAALREEREQVAEIRLTLKAEFAELSAAALKENGQQFLETAKGVLALQHQTADGDLQKKQEEIKTLVKPIEEGIKAVNQAARQMEMTRAAAFGTIEEKLRETIASSAEVAKQAGALKDALKRPNVRGRWGEVQLRICVELAGMEEHCDVEFQETSLNADDKSLRPDMIVRMPGGRKLTVDSKTPMVHFLNYIDASTDDERQAALVNHARSVKKHIGDLSKTGYMRQIAESPDFVVMFFPNESFLSMALEKEPGIIEDALTSKILIATPGTLIGLLKVIQFGWNEQKIAQSAQRIADEGSKLNGEIVKFLADYAKLGLALDSVNEAFNSSRWRVEHRIAKHSLNLTELGAKNISSLKEGKRILGEVSNILKAAGASDDDIESTENPEHLALTAVPAEDESE
jgi:DNA recombination protein RmuC